MVSFKVSIETFGRLSALNCNSNEHMQPDEVQALHEQVATL